MSMTIRQEKSKIVQHGGGRSEKEAVRGEVRPPAAAPVIYIKDRLLTAGSMRWDFQDIQKSGF